MGWGPSQAGPARVAWASFPEETVLVKMPASKWPSFPASGGALGATSALSPSPQVPEEPEFSLVLVLEVPAFLVGLVEFLGLEALQVVSVPAGVGVSWRRPRGKASPSAAVSPGVGTPAAAAKAAAKAAKYGECPQGRKARDSGLPSGPGSLPRPLLGLGDLSSLRLNGLGLCPSVETSLPPPQTCLSGHSAWPCLLFFTDWPSNGGPLWSIWLLPPYSKANP